MCAINSTMQPISNQGYRAAAVVPVRYNRPRYPISQQLQAEYNCYSGYVAAPTSQLRSPSACWIRTDVMSRQQLTRHQIVSQHEEGLPGYLLTPSMYASQPAAVQPIRASNTYFQQQQSIPRRSSPTYLDSQSMSNGASGPQSHLPNLSQLLANSTAPTCLPTNHSIAPTVRFHNPTAVHRSRFPCHPTLAQGKYPSSHMVRQGTVDRFQGVLHSEIGNTVTTSHQLSPCTSLSHAPVQRVTNAPGATQSRLPFAPLEGISMDIGYVVSSLLNKGVSVTAQPRSPGSITVPGTMPSSRPDQHSASRGVVITPVTKTTAASWRGPVARGALRGKTKSTPATLNSLPTSAESRVKKPRRSRAKKKSADNISGRSPTNVLPGLLFDLSDPGDTSGPLCAICMREFRSDTELGSHYPACNQRLLAMHVLPPPIKRLLLPTIPDAFDVPKLLSPAACAVKDYSCGVCRRGFCSQWKLMQHSLDCRSNENRPNIVLNDGVSEDNVPKSLPSAASSSSESVGVGDNASTLEERCRKSALIIKLKRIDKKIGDVRCFHIRHSSYMVMGNDVVGRNWCNCKKCRISRKCAKPA